MISTLAMLAISGVTSYGWGIGGTVLCTSGAGIPNVTIVVNGSSTCDSPFTVSVTTDSTGSYFALLPPCNGTYSVCVDATTLPAGDTLIGGACTNFSVTSANEFATADFTVSCGTPPPCPNCVAPVLGLGSAAGCTVLELGASSVSITGPAGGIFGNICMAPNSKLSLTGSEFVTGTIELGPGATFSDSSSGAVGGVAHNVDLSAEISDAKAAAAADAALPCTQTFTTLDGNSVKTITGVSGVNVICVQNISLSGKQILLTGPADASFIFNVTGKFVFTGGGLGPQIRVDASAGLKPSAVLYNIIGTGQDVALNGGGGGVNCCAAIVDGTILAPQRKIALSPGLVNGEVISGLDISIVSGSSVRCPPCP